MPPSNLANLPLSYLLCLGSLAVSADLSKHGEQNATTILLHSNLSHPRNPQQNSLSIEPNIASNDAQTVELLSIFHMTLIFAYSFYACKVQKMSAVCATATFTNSALKGTTIWSAFLCHKTLMRDLSPPVRL